MAINLTVALTDNEQARLAAIAAEVAPGMSPAQVKAWAEGKAKDGLREAVVEVWQQYRREQENAARQAADAALAGDWADPEPAA